MMRRHKRLADRLIWVFEAACAANDLDVAGRLLVVAEMLLRNDTLSGRERGGLLVDLADAHGRLWMLRHPAEAFASPMPAL